MTYKITKLSSELIYICWERTPEVGEEVERTFLAEIKQLLAEAEQPIFFISDLRQGRITNIDILRQLGTLSRHEKWGGGTGFSTNPITSMYASIYKRFSARAKERDAMFEQPEEAIAFLESLKPGLTQGVDWASVLAAD